MYPEAIISHFTSLKCGLHQTSASWDRLLRSLCKDHNFSDCLAQTGPMMEQEETSAVGRPSHPVICRFDWNLRLVIGVAADRASENRVRVLEYDIIYAFIMHRWRPENMAAAHDKPGQAGLIPGGSFMALSGMNDYMSDSLNFCPGRTLSVSSLASRTWAEAD